MLEKEIGYSPLEFKAKRSQGKTDPRVKDKLRQVN